MEPTIRAYGDAFAGSIDAAQKVDKVQDTRNHPVPQQISEMTDREIAEETLYWLRQAGQALANIQQQGIMGMMKSMRG